VSVRSCGAGRAPGDGLTAPKGYRATDHRSDRVFEPGRIHGPDDATIADKMLYMVAAMERDLIRERTLNGLRAA
jgi:hypothetical protein